MRGETPAATRNHHPATRQQSATLAKARGRGAHLEIPSNRNVVELSVAGHSVKLTNLLKPFWPDRGITKGDLLRYYLAISRVLLPHLADRAMVMKRYPNGIKGEFFFMKRAPSPRPEWIDTCSIEHASGNVISFPVIRDVASLLWVVNLGCIDLNQWYARCDDVDKPDYLHFDLDPVDKVPFSKVIEGALFLREALVRYRMPNYVKTSGSRGLHIYIPIVRGPSQHQVWSFAKALAKDIARQKPDVLTAEYRKSLRPSGHVLIDYNQNAWGRTLASVYSVRPIPSAAVSTPVEWKELESGVKTEDFRIDNVPARVNSLGDLWKPLLRKTGRFHLERFL